MAAYLAACCQGLLFVTFAVAAVAKLSGRNGIRALADSLIQADLTSARIALAVATGLVSAEAVTAGLLLLFDTRGLGFGAAVLVLTILTAGVVRVLKRHTSAVCHCFGTKPRRLAPRHVVRNVILIAVAMFGSIAASVGAAADSDVYYLALATGAALAIPIIMLDHLTDLVRPSRQLQGHR